MDSILWIVQWLILLLSQIVFKLKLKYKVVVNPNSFWYADKLMLTIFGNYEVISYYFQYMINNVA